MSVQVANHKEVLRSSILNKEGAPEIYDGSDKECILDLLVDSFTNSNVDPMLHWLVRDDNASQEEFTRRLREMCRWMFGWINHAYYSRGIVLVTKDDAGSIVGAMTISPPGIKPQSLMNTIKLVFKYG